MSTYSSAANAPEAVYAHERRLEAEEEQHMSWHYGYPHGGPRAYYSQGLPPLVQGPPGTMPLPLRSMSGSSEDSQRNYTWQTNAHLQPPSAYSSHEYHREGTPPADTQYATVSPQRISPAPHSAPVTSTSMREMRTPSPALAPTTELPEEAAYPPMHYQPRQLNMSPERMAPPKTSSIHASMTQQPAAPPSALPDTEPGASEDTSTRCTVSWLSLPPGTLD